MAAGAGAASVDGSSRSATADRLLQTAAALFREKGYAATTTRELSERLGIEKGSLYHHVRGKEDLLLSISVKSLRRIEEAVAAAAAAAEPAERLEAVIATHVQTALDDRDMHATMLIELRALSPERQREVLERREAYERMLEAVVREAQDAGRLRADIDAHHLTLALLNLLNWTIFWFDPTGEQSSAEIAAMLSAVFLDGAREGPRG